MERIHERSLKLLLNDYSNSDAESLEKKQNKSVSMETERLCRIAYAISKTLNNLNPAFMNDISHNRE